MPGLPSGEAKRARSFTRNSHPIHTLNTGVLWSPARFHFLKTAVERRTKVLDTSPADRLPAVRAQFGRVGVGARPGASSSHNSRGRGRQPRVTAATSLAAHPTNPSVGRPTRFCLGYSAGRCKMKSRLRSRGETPGSLGNRRRAYGSRSSREATQGRLEAVHVASGGQSCQRSAARARPCASSDAIEREYELRFGERHGGELERVTTVPADGGPIEPFPVVLGEQSTERQRVCQSKRPFTLAVLTTNPRLPYLARWHHLAAKVPLYP